MVNITTFHDSPTYLLSIGKISEGESAIKVYYGETCHIKKIMEDLRIIDNGVKEKSLRQILKDKGCAQALSLAVAINFSVAFR